MKDLAFQSVIQEHNTGKGENVEYVYTTGHEYRQNISMQPGILFSVVLFFAPIIRCRQPHTNCKPAMLPIYNDQRSTEVCSWIHHSCRERQTGFSMAGDEESGLGTEEWRTEVVYGSVTTSSMLWRKKLGQSTTIMHTRTKRVHR